MAKGLPILGIVGAVFAAAVVAVLADAALFVVVVMAVVGSIVLLTQRSVAGAVAGLVVLALGVVAGLGLAGSVTTEDGGETDLGVGPDAGILFALAAMLALPVAAVALRWDEAQPRWAAIAGLAAAVVGFAVAALDPNNLADHGTVRAGITALLCLLAMAGPVVLLRAGEDAPARPAAAPTPLATADAPLKSAPKPAPKTPRKGA